MLCDWSARDPCAYPGTLCEETTWWSCQPLHGRPERSSSVERKSGQQRKKNFCLFHMGFSICTLVSWKLKPEDALAHYLWGQHVSALWGFESWERRWTWRKSLNYVQACFKILGEQNWASKREGKLVGTQSLLGGWTVPPGLKGE